MLYDCKMKKSPYLAFDTETINRPGHGYACLVMREKSPGGEVIHLENPQTFEQIFNFMAPGRYTAFNADFDIRAAFLHPRFIPARIIEDLANFDCAAWGDYAFFYIPGKHIKIFKWREKRGASIEIFDLKSFFQGHSLKTAAAAYLPKERKHEIPNRWYSEIDRCLKDHRRGKVISYAYQDVKVLAQLHKVLIESFTACGMDDPPLYSPGAASMEVFGDISKKNALTNYQNEFFRKAYRGGRIEVAELGAIKNMNFYDLKSAYPAETAELPEIQGAAWREGGLDWKYDPSAIYGAYNVEVEIPINWAFGPFPVEHDGKIIFPVGHFGTWIGLAGIKLLREFKLPFKVLEYQEFYGGRDKKPYAELINELFKLRKDPKKNLAVKLILNSVYGKKAESQNYNIALPAHLYPIFKGYFNSDRAYGKYTNFAEAGAITEGTRLKLWRAAHKYGAVMLATDGIITPAEIPAPGTLGEFDFKGKIKRGVILGCGRYMLEYSNGHKEYHLRGFSKPERLFKKFANLTDNSYTAMVLDTDSVKQWNKSLNKSDFNVLTNILKTITIEDNKRFWLGSYFPKIKDYFRKNLKSQPWRIEHESNIPRTARGSGGSRRGQPAGAGRKAGRVPGRA